MQKLKVKKVKGKVLVWYAGTLTVYPKGYKIGQAVHCTVRLYE